MNSLKEVEKRIYLLCSIIFLLLVISIVPVYAEQFNIEVQIPETYKVTAPGTEIWFTTNIINLGNIDRIDVVLNSEIVDEQGLIKASKTKTVAMETTAAFVNSIKLPDDIPPGKYYVVASITFPDRTIESREQFVVQIENNDLLRIIIIVIAALIIILIIFFIIRANKPNIEKLALHIKIREIVRKRFKK